MKVIVSEENKLEFDNGLEVTGYHSKDCCEYNFLDFEQIPVGTEFPDYTAPEFVAAITIKKDGFIIKDTQGTPKWVQARSQQNGYYGNSVDMLVKDKNMAIEPKRLDQEYGELFEGQESE